MSQKTEGTDLSLFGEADPLVGTVLGGRWKIEQFLGEGSLSSAYRAKDKQADNAPRVLKRIHKHLLANIRNPKKFETKCRALASIKGEHIAAYIDIFNAPDGSFFLIMDEIHFESLEDLLSKSGHISIERAINVFKQVCLALEQGEAASCEHRDLKPSNIIIVDNDKFVDDVKVLDFGIARLLADESEYNKSAQYITHTREVFGSPLYLSPEQCTGKRLDVRSDIYSLGCVMYEAITGKPPFVGKNVLETAYKHMNEAPKQIELEDADQAMVGRLETVIFKCLEKDPDLRYQSINDLRHDLELLLVCPEEEWQTTAYALRKATSSSKRKKGLLVSSEFMLFGVLTVILIGVPIFWVTTSFGTPQQKYPDFNNEHLWVVASKKENKSEVEGFGPRQEAAKDALELVKEEQGINSEEYANALSSLVELYANSGHWKEAEDRTKQLIEVTQKVKGPWPVAQSYRILGYVTFMQDENDEAIEACNKAVSLMENDPLQQRAMIQPLRVLGDIYSRKGDLEKAVATFEKLFGIVDITKETDPPTYADTCSKLADAYRRQQKYTDSERYYRLGLEWWRNHGKADVPYAAKSLYGLGLVLVAEGKFEDAKETFKEAIPITKSTIGERSALMGAVKKQYVDVLWRINPMEALKAQMSEGESSSATSGY